ncbi:MAG TPA: hypothetical protein VN793_02745 [Acidimicrobiales bacterium]|nr:hypothetical protein [Acidimicrobiales bacterium]
MRPKRVLTPIGVLASGILLSLATMTPMSASAWAATGPAPTPNPAPGGPLIYTAQPTPSCFCYFCCFCCLCL